MSLFLVIVLLLTFIIATDFIGLLLPIVVDHDILSAYLETRA